MIKFKTPYAVQIFTGNTTTGKAKKVECADLVAVKAATDAANKNGKAAISWSAGGMMGEHLPEKK